MANASKIELKGDSMGQPSLKKEAEDLVEELHEEAEQAAEPASETV